MTVQALNGCSPVSMHRSATNCKSSCDIVPDPCSCERAVMSWTRLRAASALGRLPGWLSCCRASCSALQPQAIDSAALCHLYGHNSQVTCPPGDTNQHPNAESVRRAP